MPNIHPKNIIHISEDELINFHSDTSLHNSSIKTSAMRENIAEVRYEIIVKSKYKYGDTIFVINENNEILEQEVYEIAVACIQDRQTISYNGFHSKLVFPSYDTAKKAMEATFI